MRNGQVYWSSFDDSLIKQAPDASRPPLGQAKPGRFTPRGGIAKVPLAGGATQTIPLDEKSVGCPHRIAADAANIYYTSTRGVTKLPK